MEWVQSKARFEHVSRNGSHLEILTSRSAYYDLRAQLERIRPGTAQHTICRLLPTLRLGNRLVPSTVQTSAIPMRLSQRKCDLTPARKDLCATYLKPKSLQVSSTTEASAG